MRVEYTPCELPRWYTQTVELLNLLREKTESRELNWRKESYSVFVLFLWNTRGHIIIQSHDRPFDPWEEEILLVSLMRSYFFEYKCVSVRWTNNEEDLVICPPSFKPAGPEQSRARLLFDYAEALEKEDIVSNLDVLQQVFDKIEALKES